MARLALAIGWAAALFGAACGGASGGAARDAAGDGPPDAAAGTGGSAGAGGAAGMGGSGAVDCRGSCDRIAAICEGMSTIDENWLSICRQNCEVRLAVMPETAQAEVACVAAAGDCATAILCSVSPTGGDR